MTDAHDRRTLMSILAVFYSDTIFSDDYKFSPSGLYYAPSTSTAEETVLFIRNLPIIAAPEVFGLHANADITKDQQETDLMLDSVLLMQVRTGRQRTRSGMSLTGALRHTDVCNATIERNASAITGY